MECAPVCLGWLTVSIGIKGPLPSGPISLEVPASARPLLASVGLQTAAALLENLTRGAVRGSLFTTGVSLRDCVRVRMRAAHPGPGK